MIEMSFSQHNTYRRCKRQWAFDKVDSLRGLPSMAAVRGTRYHAAIENWVKGADPVLPENPLVRNAVDVVRGFDEYEAEAYVEEIVDDIKVRGYIDALGTNWIDRSGSGDSDTYSFDYSETTVIDWKFPSKSPGNAAKPEHITQINLYGYLCDGDRGMVAYPEYDKYFEFDINQDAGERTCDLLVETAIEIRDTKALETPGAETEPTPNYLCKNYCAYRAICPLGGNQ